MDLATGEVDRWSAAPAGTGLESPFSEAPFASIDRYITPAMMLSLSPFSDGEAGDIEGEAESLLRDVYGELRDDSFYEAVAALTDEIEAAAEQRFQGEVTSNSGERERFARSYVAPLQFEADQYLTSLEAGLAELEPTSLSSEELDEALARYDPSSADLSPASEEFIGGLIKKAKGVVKKVTQVAKQAAKLASPLLGPILSKLRGLIKPLLERVLRFAIGKLPTALQPQARIVADRILGKDTSSATPAAPAGGAVSPAQATSTDELTDSFDLSLAEAVAFPQSFEGPDRFGADHEAPISTSEELEQLAEARSELIARMGDSASAEALEPHIEQFAPILLAALRTGIKFVGRPKVVSFLAKYLAKMVSQWVGPDTSKPLSQAIVDAGLKMISLEAEGPDEIAPSGAGSVALASVVEDTIRRLAEAEDYLFEDSDLTKVALAEAFGEAAATYLPQDSLREELQLAPTLGGRFVTHRPSRLRSYAKYSRVPEVTISSRTADSIPSFGGHSLGATMRAAGARFPMRARMHIFHAKPGSSAAAMMRHGLHHSARRAGIHPLTPAAAGALLREPALGVAGAARFMRSARQIGVGQRLYVLEPLDQSIAAVGGGKQVPGKAWLSVNAAKARITLGFYLAEADAQQIAGALRGGHGHGEILRRLLTAYRAQSQQKDDVTGGLVHEDGEDFAGFAKRAASTLPNGFLPMLRERIAGWALPALSDWLRSNTEAFQRAVADPDPGVRILVRLLEVPGLSRAVAGGPGATLAALQSAMRGKPKIVISASPGSKRR